MKPTQPRIIIVLSGCFGAVIGAETLLVELGNQGYRLNVVLRCDSPEVIKTAVSKKLGVGFLYEDSVKEGLASGVFKKLRISGLQMEGTSYIVFHKQRRSRPVARCFSTCCDNGAMRRGRKKVSWMAKARGEKRKAIRGSDWHYLLRVQENFEIKDISAQGQNWFNQFVYD